MSYRITHVRNFHGVCPPGFEKVGDYKKKDGTHVKEHCRKLTVSGRTKSAILGIYNETMIAQEDARLGFDSIVDSTTKGEKGAERIEKRAEKIKAIMKDQEEKKKEVRKMESNENKIEERKKVK